MKKIEYGLIVKKSFSLAKKEKWLLVYGLTIASLTGGSGSNFSRQFDSQEAGTLAGSLPENVQALVNSFLYWVQHLNPGSLGAFLGGTGILFIFSIIIAWVASSWAQAALIKGSEDGLENKKVDFKKLSKEGIGYIKKFIIFAVLTFLAGLVFGIAVAIAAGLIALLSVVAKVYVLAVILGVAAVAAFIYGVIILTLMTNFAQRLIVLKNYTPANALKTGLKTATQHFWNGVKLGVLNSLVSLGIGLATVLVIGLVLGIPAIILASPIFDVIAGKPLTIAPVSVAGLLSLLLLFIWSNKIVSAFLVVYKATTWNMFFKEIWKEN